ncbi:MAG: hypothetical protein ACR2F6_07515 [Mycobacteriales bacterium]
MNLEYARTVADAVLYEGYLLYPYRASSSKNQSRWQFGVIGPPGAAERGIGEDAAMGSQFVVRVCDRSTPAVVAVGVRFLQLQSRSAQQADGADGFIDVAELVVDDRRWLTWDEAVEREITRGPWRVDELGIERVDPVDAPAGEEIEPILDEAGTRGGQLVRAHREVRAQLHVRAEPIEGNPDLFRLCLSIENRTPDAAASKESAIAASLIGAHMLVSIENGEFASMTDPPLDAVDAVARCVQHRSWPVLAGPEGDRSVMLVTPIILADHPEIAPQSSGSLFDSTEIDEILTLRVMTLTEEEKAAARATDPRAAEIIERCDAMSPEAMQQLHGVLRDPHALDVVPGELDELLVPHGSDVDLTSSLGFGDDVPWWDPAVDGSVSPSTDEVVINGVTVSAGSIVRIHPARRADAQDIFFTDQIARVSAVHSDVDGDTHVAVVLRDDPAADLHDWYGRYLYFAPDELEPMPASPPSSSPADNREESRP